MNQKLKALDEVQESINRLSLLTEDNVEVQDLIMCAESYMADAKSELEFEAAMSEFKMMDQ